MRRDARTVVSSARREIDAEEDSEQQLSSVRQGFVRRTQGRSPQQSRRRSGEESDTAVTESVAAERAFAVLRERLAGRCHEAISSETDENRDPRSAFSECTRVPHRSASTPSSSPLECSASASDATDAACGSPAHSLSAASGFSESTADDTDEDESLLKIFCVCAPGLEGLLARELLSLRFPPPPPFSRERGDSVSPGDSRSDEKARLQEAAVSAAAAAAEAANRLVINGPVDGKYRGSGGGVEVTGTLETLWNICLRSRLTDAVRVRIGSPFPAQRETTLLRRLCALPWQKFVPLVADLGEPVVSVRVRRSRLHHTKMLEEMTAAAVKENKKKFIHESKRDGLPPHLRGRGGTVGRGCCMLGIAGGVPANTPRRRHAFFDFPIHSPSRFAAFLDCPSLSRISHMVAGALGIQSIQWNAQLAGNFTIFKRWNRGRATEVRRQETSEDYRTLLIAMLEFTNTVVFNR
ncbi:unnamed protein product [Neospora caninum Liverpool]|uniref:Uncharacterized protein n=1 Tax=Neospora caninum (strain Liverpool) TaxID=572307 RepID=F0V862_NEOCL|nr:uncharacterized protein NCLIV_003875 [Neospora caninum Liverpool]CBZ49903.1 unnamed protein product [Neospora caninum Liverpool]|eukprot:XP_003879938.1 uncharacterized protein NCLIV_003875 [Neospora caninum Liverpool]